jgi:hypothetical protein
MQLSWVKALQDFMSRDNGRKVEIPEFKALTEQDKSELREMLIAEGYDVLPIGSKGS